MGRYAVFYVFFEITTLVSLLGTWNAKEASESWDPESSNILQVILSIQGLILGTNCPFFLEAGYDKLKVIYKH